MRTYGRICLNVTHLAMSRFTQPSQDESNYILVARMDNARNLSSILKAVNFREVSFWLTSHHIISYYDDMFVLPS